MTLLGGGYFRVQCLAARTWRVSVCQPGSGRARVRINSVVVVKRTPSGNRETAFQSHVHHMRMHSVTFEQDINFSENQSCLQPGDTLVYPSLGYGQGAVY